MKRVTFKVAQVIKDCGYPQDYTKCDVWFSSDGKMFNCTEDYSDCYASPTYIEVWLWLWRVKKKNIDVVALADGSCGTFIWKFGEWISTQIKFEDPEEAIIASIEHLVNNNLIE